MMEQKHNCQQQLEDLRKEYEEFAYIVSHDLKAPLRAISNLSAWIREDMGDNLEADIQNNIRLLQQRTERMERMINGLLDFSRIPRFDLEIQEVNVQELVEQLASQLKEQHTVALHATGLPTFTTYGRKLETVFQHLLQNAVSHNENPTREIWVEASEQADTYQFRVKDNGIGIWADAQERVFRMFYTVQPKDQHESLGVGLTITRKIIQFVGGSLDLQSEPGRGTEVTFTWPKAVY
ncbi:sensor histidine kinase [Rufibacter hautae]|uniref:histidine kinase n=1 Tax=Rufibacter hautae TaxID=2595005 RepID=A0A5B6TH42_9BACT|nr:HAMP domain-containing sensor histidine kinase [Rufibacter hautae]KAA3438572.1 HAMP domain-containing histidine kinase [Rufibacter hautae]